MESLRSPKYQNTFVPLNLHKRKGRNVQFMNDRSGIAARADGTVGQGYIFTACPMLPGQSIIVQILEVDLRFSLNYSSITFGLISKDPATLKSLELPDIAEELLNCPGYWVVRTEAMEKLRTRYELAFTLTQNGQIQLSRNGSTPVTIMDVDSTVKLWAFVDMHGSVKKVRILSSVPVMQPKPASQQLETRPKTYNQLTELPSELRITRQSSTDLNRLSFRSQQTHPRTANQYLETIEETLPLRYQNPVVPLSIHETKGRNIEFVNERTGVISKADATLNESYIFSGHPITPEEIIVIQILAVDSLLSLNYGSIIFGLTPCDPAALSSIKLSDIAEDIILYCVVDTDSIDRLKPGDELVFTVTDGRVLLSLCESTPTTVLTMDQTAQLWAFVEMYGTIKEVKILSCVPETQPEPTSHQLQINSESMVPLSETDNETPDDQLNLNHQQSHSSTDNQFALTTEESLPPLRYPNPTLPLSFHRTKGRNVFFDNVAGVAARVDATVNQGYIFTAQPMQSEQTIIVQILAVDTILSLDHVNLNFGLTSCNPDDLRTAELPDNAEDLLDRLEYWVLETDAAIDLQAGDELAFTITSDGRVELSRNGSVEVTIMHVDNSVALWAFVELGDPLMKVRMFLESVPQSTPTSKQRRIEKTPAVTIPNEPECKICFEKPVDSVLNTCGHMCMCYRCAVEVWRGKGNGQCPVCRARIKGVIRAYSS